MSQVKLIAEPWDLGEGGYQVGNFPVGWAEWNGRYRDTVRRYWRGDGGQVAELAYRLTGSSDLYQSNGRRPYASVNFTTSHDGFTLADLVSYNVKHNEANRRVDGDGADENFSWNCGIEGPTADPAIVALRRRQMRNFLATLLLSQGVPMLCGGDEIGRTQRGNNNLLPGQRALLARLDARRPRARAPGVHAAADRATAGASRAAPPRVLSRAPGLRCRDEGPDVDPARRAGDELCGLVRGDDQIAWPPALRARHGRRQRARRADHRRDPPGAAQRPRRRRSLRAPRPHLGLRWELVLDTVEDAAPAKPLVLDPATVLTLPGRSLAFLRASETSQGDRSADWGSPASGWGSGAAAR